MFERFTAEARQVVALAHDEARQLGHDYIGTEHLLLGLVRNEGGAAGVLATFGITLEGVRADVRRIVGEGNAQPRGQIPFTPRAKSVLERASQETFALKQSAIDTEHVLLGLAGGDEGVVDRIFLERRVDVAELRQRAERATELDRPSAPPERGDRLTERARSVVALAADEARALRHNYIGTEHLLLGLLVEGEGLASRVLATLDVSVDEARAQIARIVGPGDEPLVGKLPFTPRAKKVLELALREALSLGHNYIGTEHLLLGLVRENEGVAARILLDFDADAEKVRNEIIRTLSGGQRGTERRTFARPLHREWEYQLLAEEAASLALLNKIGADGWELVAAADGKLIFKRPR